MFWALLAWIPMLHAEPVGGAGQRFGFGVATGLGSGVTLKCYATSRIGISTTLGAWGLLIRRQTILVEVDAYEIPLALTNGTLVATAGLGVARMHDGFWRDETHLGVRLSTAFLWRWHDRPFEVGTEFGVDLYDYDWSSLQFGELPTATLIARWYPRFSQ